MAKGKDARVKVILECTGCVRKSVNKESRGISRYITQKNRHNTLTSWNCENTIPIVDFIMQISNC